MAYSGVARQETKAYSACPNCNFEVEPQAKFCGFCGFTVKAAPYPLEYVEAYVQTASNMAAAPTAPSVAGQYCPMPVPQGQAPTKLPSFARAPKPFSPAKQTELYEELNRLRFLLARERLFLYMHWLIFIGANIFGLWMALKCYHDYIGDEMTKVVIATTPLFFVNSMALVSLVPIKGTRAEIARLKERITHAQFNLEFGHLI